MLNFGNKKITKVYLGYVELSSSSSSAVVSYYADTNNIVQIPLASGANALTRYTPTKSGWTFVGWREDATANSTVLTSKTMGSSNISLYAVYKKTLTLSYYDGYSTSPAASTKTGDTIFNAGGNYSYPSFKMTQASYSGWTTRGWATSSSATASAAYTDGATISLTDNMTIYGLYQQTITLSYNGNGSTSGSVSSHTGTRYYNAYGTYSNPSFTLKSNGFSKTDYTFSKWAIGSTSGTQYAAGASVTLSANTTFYAIWERTSNPVYWYNGSSYGSGYPSNWTVTATDVDCNHAEDCEIYYRTPINDLYANHHEPWSLNAQATGSTGGNQYMEIVVSGVQYGSLSINGTTITSGGTYTINVSGISSVTMYASLGGHEYAVGSIPIKSIRFY